MTCLHPREKTRGALVHGGSGAANQSRGMIMTRLGRFAFSLQCVGKGKMSKFAISSHNHHTYPRNCTVAAYAPMPVFVHLGSPPHGSSRLYFACLWELALRHGGMGFGGPGHPDSKWTFFRICSRLVVVSLHCWLFFLSLVLLLRPPPPPPPHLKTYYRGRGGMLHLFSCIIISMEDIAC